MNANTFVSRLFNLNSSKTEKVKNILGLENDAGNRPKLNESVLIL